MNKVYFLDDIGRVRQGQRHKNLDKGMVVIRSGIYNQYYYRRPEEVYENVERAIEHQIVLLEKERDNYKDHIARLDRKINELRQNIAGEV